MRSRRCRSALGWSAWPQACTVVRRRMAVKVSCRRLRERTCMSFSLSLWERAGVRGNKQRKTTRQAAVEIGPGERVPSLLAPAPAAGDQLGKIAVALAVGGEHHELRPIVQPYLRADDQRQTDLFRRDMRPHHACQRALVGDGERVIAESGGAVHQFLRMRSAAKKSEVAEAMQLGVFG